MDIIQSYEDEECAPLFEPFNDILFCGSIFTADEKVAIAKHVLEEKISYRRVAEKYSLSISKIS